MEKPSGISAEEWEKAYTELMESFAGLITDHPECIDSLRENLAFGAANIICNSSKVKKDFRTLSKEMDAFVSACQTGEIDPRNFLKKKEMEK